MSMTKLTLSADKKLVERAKKLAKKQGTSLSSMFARYLQFVLQRQERGTEIAPGPITRKASGLVKLPANKSDRELIEEAVIERHGKRS